MKILKAVKTEKRAKEIICAYVKENALKEGVFDNGSTNCECGETHSVIWTNFEESLIVAVCDSCGNDERHTNEVLS